MRFRNDVYDKVFPREEVKEVIESAVADFPSNKDTIEEPKVDDGKINDDSLGDDNIVEEE